MKRRPIFYFKDMRETGIVYVPVGGIVVIGDNGKGLVDKYLVLDIDSSLTSTTTLQKWMINKTLYKVLDSNAANEVVHKKLENDIKLVTLQAIQNDDKILDNRTIIDGYTADITNLKDVALRAKVRIEKNEKDIETLQNDDHTDIALAAHARKSATAFKNVRKDHSKLQTEIETFNTDPTFGNGVDEVSLKLWPLSGQETHITSQGTDANGVPDSYDWRIGTFHGTPIGGTGPGALPEALKIESKEHDVVLAVDSKHSALIRRGGLYEHIQTSRNGTTAERPIHPHDGQFYFDNDFKKPMWFSDTGWWYADGTQVI